MAGAGPLALVGGGEFRPGNEAQDRVLLDAAAGRPAYVVATAAARQGPDAAVATARRWFRGLDVEVQELRIRTAADARSRAAANLAQEAGFFYLTGGDPGLVSRVLRGSIVWDAMRRSWRAGAALAGSSAGAMALCAWTLVRAGWPRHVERRPQEALAALPGSAFLPHFDTFGERWIPSAEAALGADVLLLGVDERTAAVWSEGSWTVLGPGRVTLIAHGRRRSFLPGQAVDGLPQPDAG